MIPLHWIALVLTASCLGWLFAAPAWWVTILAIHAALFLAVAAFASTSRRSTILGPCLHRMPGDRPTVALTFDDSPNPGSTPALLDLLREHGVRATFFCIGERVAAAPDLARRIRDEGHALGNHSHTHSPLLPFAPRRVLRADLTRCQAAIEAATGERPRLYRPPFGVRNHATFHAARDCGLEVVLWTTGGGDTGTRSPAAVAHRITRHLAPGAIILLHDHPRALDATRRILDAIAGTEPGIVQ